MAKLQAMRPDALDSLRSSLPSTYTNYYTQETNDWIRDVVRMEPFMDLGIAPEIPLVPVHTGIPAGEVDLRNCIAVHSALKNMDEATASQEVLWAGLCNGPYYGYLRSRWGLVPSALKGTAHESSSIESRFFMAGHRKGLFRNTLAKCWWVGHLLYDPDAADPYHKLWILGPASFSTIVNDIFVNNNYSFCPTVLDGIIGAFVWFNQNGAPMNIISELRPALQRLNLLGGTVLLDALPSQEITQYIVAHVDGFRRRLFGGAARAALP